jgi:signal peptidase
VGDVVTYTPPGARRRVTHRIVWAGRGATGARAFRTRGDANAAADPWRFELTGRTQPRVVAHVPWAGYAVAALSVRWVRVLVIGVPAALIAVALLAGARPPAGEARA